MTTLASLRSGLGLGQALVQWLWAFAFLAFGYFVRLDDGQPVLSAAVRLVFVVVGLTALAITTYELLLVFRWWTQHHREEGP